MHVRNYQFIKTKCLSILQKDFKPALLRVPAVMNIHVVYVYLHSSTMFHSMVPIVCLLCAYSLHGIIGYRIWPTPFPHISTPPQWHIRGTLCLGPFDMRIFFRHFANKLVNFLVNFHQYILKIALSRSIFSAQNTPNSVWWLGSA